MKTESTVGRRKVKVFGLGLSKTGTSSLAVALRQLGYKTRHNPTDDVTVQALLNGSVRCPASEDNDAVCDILFVRHFRELDNEFAGSKFVLTIRSLPEWLESCRRHWAGRQALLRDLANEDLVDFNVYGTTCFRERIFRATYNSHCHAIQEYFRNRNDDLLVLNICAGEGWKELCGFLGELMPQEPFPHVRPAPWRRLRLCVAYA